MISLKPIYLWKYLKTSVNKVPSEVKRLFYLSWEDALWDLLEKKNIRKGSVILVPEFYCGDVENNIRNHGYRIVYYPVSKHLQTSKQEITNSIKKSRPSLVVILHSVGINNKLLADISRLTNVNQDFILIEDSVHRIVDPSELKFIKKNHFVIDSLRKVVPLQGSVIYGKAEDLNFSEPPFYQLIFYSIRVIILWLIMNLFWSITQVLHNFKISVLTAKTALYIMKTGYDLIGDSNKPAKGPYLFHLFQLHLDFKKIKATKQWQVELYEHKLSGLSPKIFGKIPYAQADKKELMAYPLVLNLEYADKVRKFLHEKGLLLNFELNDSQWSKKHKIIYLPLGLHLNKSAINSIADQVLNIESQITQRG